MNRMQIAAKQIMKNIDRRILIKDYLALVDYGEQLDAGDSPDLDKLLMVGVKARGALYRTFPELEDGSFTVEEFMTLTDDIARKLYTGLEHDEND